MTALRDLYPMPGIDDHWHVPQQFDAVFDWRFDEGRTTLMHLYQKGKDMQWDALARIDWTRLDPENPMQMPDEAVAIYGSDVWNRMTKQERINLRRHTQAGISASSCKASRPRCWPPPRLFPRCRTSTRNSMLPRR